jgi:hypothetical protein
MLLLLLTSKPSANAKRRDMLDMNKNYMDVLFSAAMQ